MHINIRNAFGAMSFLFSCATAQEQAQDSLAQQPIEQLVGQPVQQPEPMQIMQPVQQPQQPAYQPAQQLVPLPSQAAIAVQPAPATPKAPASDSNFTKLHGYAYNAVGNPVAFNTVRDYKKMPSLMFGNKFLYVEPAEENPIARAITAFGNENHIWIFGLDNSDKMGVIDYTSRRRTYREGSPVGEEKSFLLSDINGIDGSYIHNVGLFNIGLARQSLGLLFHLGFDKTHSIEKISNKKSSTTIINAGDIYGASFSVNVGGYILRILGSHYTFDENFQVSNTTINNNAIIFDMGFGNFTSGENYFWETGIFVERINSRMKSDDELASARDLARMEFAPFFNFGYKVLSDSRARVMIGLNNQFVIDIYDHLKDINYNHSFFGLFIEPNILGEVLLSKYWIAFAEATHVFEAFFDSDKEGKTSASRVSNSVIRAYNANTKASAGLRFQHDRFALETVFANEFYKNPLQKDWFKYSLGGFIYF